MNFVSESIVQSVVFMEDVIDDCNDLKEDNRLVTDFFYELKILWKKLRDLFACSCHLPPFQ